MNRKILISFKSNIDRDAVREHLSACALLDSELDIKEFDDSLKALQELKQKQFSCGLIEPSEGMESAAISSIETPIVFVPGDEIWRSRPNNLFPHAWVPKSQLNSAWLNAYLPLLFDRSRLLIELKDASQPFERRDLDKEITGLMSWYYRTTATAQAMGLGSVRECAPEKFQQMVDRYGQLIDLAVEERTFRVPATSSTSLHDLSQQLGLLNAGPRDVIELYAASVKQKLGTANSARSKAFAHSAQVLALELMGYLVSYYRNLARLALQRVVAPTEDHRRVE